MRHITKAIFFIVVTSSGSAFAATYYVKPTGNDNANGLSHATAWKSLNKINSFSFKAGDDVYLLSGGSWKGQIRVRWNGTASNRATVGSYYMNNGSENIGVKSGARKPTIIGGYPLVNTSGAIPSGNYGALIQVNANYVTIQNLRAEKSSGTGINLGKEKHHAIFENNETDVSAGSAILFQRRSYSNIMRNNRMRKCAQGWKDGNWVGKTWPVCSGAIGSRNNIIEGNSISESYGEGIVAFDLGANNNIIRGNTIFAVRSANIYIDNGANNIVENNKIIGAQIPSEYTMLRGGYNGGALNLNVEDYPTNVNAVGNVFRNNVIANTYNCIGIGMEAGARKKGYKVGGTFIGNTCVNTYLNVRMAAPSANIERIEIANNVFHKSVKGGDACTAQQGSNISVHHNYWDDLNADSSCNSVFDVIGGLALKRTSNWGTTKSLRQIPNSDAFTPQAGSPVLQTGKHHKDLPVDYFGYTRLPQPDMGAIDISGKDTINASINPPTAPSLKITR